MGIFGWRGTLPRLGSLAPPLGSKPRIHDPTFQNHVSRGTPSCIVPTMFGFIAHPKPPGTRLQPDTSYIVWVLIWLKYRVRGQIGEILLLVDLGFNVIEENEEFFCKFFYF